MLRRALCAAFAGLALAALPTRASAAPTQAEPSAGALREPVRLTVGASSELMGVLAPDGSALYFVSDQSGTADVMRQAPVTSPPAPLSRGLGDAVGPELSPSGAQLAFISYERDSTGDLCVKPLRDGGAPERCMARPESAALEVLWEDEHSLLLLSRKGLHGDFTLERVPSSLRGARPLLSRNMIGIALSPDRRWLAYIPVDRAAEEVGVTFAQRTGVGIGLARPDGAAAPRSYVPRLPGTTGSVAFSDDGRFLYFAQFLNDTNRDGRIDGDDNAVIFRVPFRSERSEPLSAADEPEQLTSARWDCHYPAPAREVLIASCSHEGSLDVYELPLEGAVPYTWDDARVAAELAVARDPWTRLLLLARRLVLAEDQATREAIVTETLLWHIALGEYESAIYDAEHRLESPEARAFGKLLAELARHRSADLALIQGETSEEYIESERARAAALRSAGGDEPPRIAQLRRLVISEIEEDVGDKQRALATFDEVELARLADPSLAPLAARRAERLYRLRGERERLLGVYLTLAGLSTLPLPERLAFARRFVDELGRGRSRTERGEALKRYRARLADDTELALLLDVESALLTLDDSRQEEVRKQIFALYTKNREPSRRRALVLDTLRAAAKLGNEYLQYQFVTSWTSSLRPEHPERKYAEALYDAIVLDRAYGEGRQGAIGESRGYFYGATVATDSLEAHIGFIEARMAEGGPDAARAIDDAYARRFAGKKRDPARDFVEAYRLARGLPEERDAERHAETVERVVRLLARVAAARPKEPQVHQVWGFALHQGARRRGSRQAAVAANRQYLLALDLARDDERLSATLLHRLGLLQAAMGNHGVALRYLRQRDELPHVRPLEELALRIATARSAWHTDAVLLARDQLRAAEKLIAAHPELARFAPVVADRLGLVLLRTDPSAARAAYEQLASHLASDPETLASNQLKAHLGIASSALASGAPERALRALPVAERVAARGDPLAPEPEVVYSRSLTDDYRYSALQYRALAAGLRAEAARALDDTSGALAATEERIALLAERLEESEADEDRLALAQAYLHLAKLRYELKRLPGAARAVEHGLALTDAYNESTGSEVNDVELALIQAYAELLLYGGVTRDALRREPREELVRAYRVLCKYRNPRLFAQRFLFKTYLAELALTPPR